MQRLQRCRIPFFVTQRRSLFVIPLKRSLLRVKGKDSITFLQSLVSTDVSLLSDEKPLQHALLLSPAGRYLFDCFITKELACSDSPSSSFVLDVAEEDSELVQRHLDFFVLSSDVDVDPLDSATYRVCQWLPEKENSAALDVPYSKFGPNCVVANDPRIKFMGWRSITTADELDSLTKEMEEQSGEKIGAHASVDIYDKSRFLYGIAEGEKEQKRNKGIPLECSSQHFNSVNIRKGCYIGQELIARVHYKGTVRKSIVGVTWKPEQSETQWTTPDKAKTILSDPSPSPDTIEDEGVIRNQAGKKIGKILSHSGTFGLAMLRREALNILDDSPDKFTNEAGLVIEPIKPHWWRPEVKE